MCSTNTTVGTLNVAHAELDCYANNKASLTQCYHTLMVYLYNFPFAL